MSYIGSKPANKPVVASDLDPAVITGQTALAVAPAATDEFLISDAGTLKRLDASLIGGANTPAFFINKSSSQSINDNTYTQITFDSEIIDTDNAFASNTFTVPTGEAGKYFISFQCFGYDGAANIRAHRIKIYKNDSSIARSQIDLDGQDLTENTLVLSCVLDLSAGDTIKFYANLNTTDSGTADVNGDSIYRSFVQGYKLIT